jgi:hypothetical protein
MKKNNNEEINYYNFIINENLLKIYEFIHNMFIHNN